MTCQAGRIGDGANVTADAGGYRPDSSYTRCRNTATHRLSSGCVHEHLLTWLVCGQCAAAILRQWRSRREAAKCVPCERLGHRCQVLVSAEEGQDA